MARHAPRGSCRQTIRASRTGAAPAHVRAPPACGGRKSAGRGRPAAASRALVSHNQTILAHEGAEIGRGSENPSSGNNCSNLLGPRESAFRASRLTSAQPCPPARGRMPSADASAPATHARDGVTCRLSHECQASPSYRIPRTRRHREGYGPALAGSRETPPRGRLSPRLGQAYRSAPSLPALARVRDDSAPEDPRKVQENLFVRLLVTSKTRAQPQRRRSRGGPPTNPATRAPAPRTASASASAERPRSGSRPARSGRLPCQ